VVEQSDLQNPDVFFLVSCCFHRSTLHKMSETGSRLRPIIGRAAGALNSPWGVVGVAATGSAVSLALTASGHPPSVTATAMGQFAFGLYLANLLRMSIAGQKRTLRSLASGAATNQRSQEAK
jgi:hypothetical protein